MLLPLLDTPPARDALRLGDTTLTHAQLAARAREHARSLLEAGLAPGERVLVWATPSVDTVVALAGHALAGLVSVPVSPSLSDAQLAHVVRDAAPRAVVGDIEARRVAPLPVLALGRHRATSPLPPPGAGAPVAILYTSGTTGAPKGVVHTHGSFAFTIDAVARAWQWQPHEVLVHALPLFHGHGLVLGLFGPLRLGGTLRMLPAFEPRALAEAMREEGQVLFGSPAMLQTLGELSEREAPVASALRSARLLVTGSAPFPAREQARLLRATGHRVVERYGTTETFINTSTRLGAGGPPGQVGPALEGVEVRLVDDARLPLTRHDGKTVGEVAVRSPSMFREYLNRPEATAAARDAQGWFYTGDLGTLAPDGTLRLLGRRATDLITTGGHRVAAGEVEAALLECEQVREAAVVGLADAELGERIMAFVALHEGQQATPAALLERAASLLAPHQRPGALRIVPALPRNEVGKVVKTALRAQA